jgi:hypothetical protein
MKNFLSFTPESINYVKNKAKKLQKANPGMELSLAQETTSSALGYQSWFDCQHRLRGTTEKGRAVFDEDLPSLEFYARRHYQYCVLVEVGKLPPGHAEIVVRTWGLSSKNSSAHFQELHHPFTELLADVSAVEAGDIDWERKGWDYPPEKINDHIALGHIAGAKRRYYVLDHWAYNQLPAYMRGNAMAFLDFESGLSLGLFFPELKSLADDGEAYLSLYAPYHYDWYLGRQGHQSKVEGNVSLAELEATTARSPTDWFPLSFRSVFNTEGDFSNNKEYIVALKGREFAQFIRDKGELALADTQWFSVPKQQKRNYMPGFTEKEFLLNPLRVDDLEACSPVYHSPFKHGPMDALEYNWSTEGGGLRLDEEIDWAEFT